MEEENKKIVQERLAQSVMEKGSVKCPSCSNLIEWKDSEEYNPDGSKDRYFWCSNDQCELHRRDVVKVSISTGFIQTFKQKFSKIGQGAIAALFGALSMYGYNILNPTDGNNQAIDDLKIEKNRIDSINNSLTKQISALELAVNQPISPSDNIPSIPGNARKTIDSLQRILVEKNNEIVKLGNQQNTTQFSPQQSADLGMFFANQTEPKSKEARQYLFQALDNPNAGFSDDKYETLVTSLIELRAKLKLDEFERTLKHIENHIPNNRKDVEKARVYWYYADAQKDYKEFRRLRLSSLKHYLQGASRYNIGPSDIDDGKKLIFELFKLDSVDPMKFNSTMDIGTAYSIQDKNTIRNFLEYGMKPESKLFEEG